MKVKFYADWEIFDRALGDDVYTLKQLIRLIPQSSGYILDWGGGEGKQCKSIIDNTKFSVINMDPSVESLKRNSNGVLAIQGIGQYLPFKDGLFDAIHISAALHHAWKELIPCLAEIYRVTKPRGVILLWEPLNSNPIAWLARKLFVPDGYDPNEKPLDNNMLLKAISLDFNITTVKYYYIFSYTLPFLVARLPLKSFWRKLALISCEIDRLLLKYFPFTQHFAAYVKIIAVRKT
jgi:ubiquinone/menaquinone biosynthesis C-methylase UbiE